MAGGFRFADSSTGGTAPPPPPRNKPTTSTSTQRSLPDLPPVDLSSPPPLPPPARPREPSKKGKEKETEMIVIDDDEEEEDEEEQFVEVSLPRRQQDALVGGKDVMNEGGVQVNTEEDEAELAKLDVELASIDQQIRQLQSLRSSLSSDRSTLYTKIQSHRQSLSHASSLSTTSSSSSLAPNALTNKSNSLTNYTTTSFSWSNEARKVLQRVFGQDFKFRYVQEAAINASLDGREVVCVMPTGGGKSLVYQIPAIMSKGTTIVITPLISLMYDQVYNLRSKGVVAEMLSAATPQDESRSILKRMLGDLQTTTTKKGKGKSKVEDNEDSESIKLVYVTPERIEKSKTFVSTLQKMYDGGLLARIVIDEAHCVSTMGHDYRPAYLSLRRLKVLFPRTPILATTATATHTTVIDMLKVLALPSTTSPGAAAVAGTTVLFTSPLYRPNLRYEVLPKPSAAGAASQALVDYILSNHEGDSGIVYCLSRADSENVTSAINELSKGRIRAATYHAYVDDNEKLRVYDLWRRKKVHVVVATAASFGLGIDAPNVRYVLHHSISSSLSSFYQESGRAGRDGEKADCVMFWRASDAARLSTLKYGEQGSGGKEKLYEMVQFAQDLKTCRKVSFAKAFAASHGNSTTFDGQGDIDEPCGNCDNCDRDLSTISSLDVSFAAYRALRILSAAVIEQHGTVTLTQAVDLVKGNGKGAFATQTTGRGGKGKGFVDVVKVAGGKVDLTKDEIEAMLMRLLVDGYLKENFHATAYSTISYLHPTNRAGRFTRLEPDQVESEGVPVQIIMDVRGGSTKSKKRKTTTGDGGAKKRRKKAAEVIELKTDEEEEEDGGSGEMGTPNGMGLESEEEERFDFEDEEGDGDPEEEEEDEAAFRGEHEGDWEVFR